MQVEHNTKLFILSIAKGLCKFIEKQLIKQYILKIMKIQIINSPKSESLLGVREPGIYGNSFELSSAA